MVVDLGSVVVPVSLHSDSPKDDECRHGCSVVVEPLEADLGMADVVVLPVEVPGGWSSLVVANDLTVFAVPDTGTAASDHEIVLP